jgi:hypothetical protein
MTPEESLARAKLLLGQSVQAVVISRSERVYVGKIRIARAITMHGSVTIACPDCGADVGTFSSDELELAP